MATKRLRQMRRALGEAARELEVTRPDLARKFRELRKPGKRGGKQPGAGRPSIFHGTRVKLSVTVTELAYGLIRQTREKLEPEHGHAATDGAAVEYLIRKATRTPLDA